MKTFNATRLIQLLFLFLPLANAVAQGTAFTYQGRLNDNGSPATGTYDFRFTAHDSSGGPNVVAGPVTATTVSVSGGLFTVVLDFGAGVFTGPARWLQIEVRTNGSVNFVALTPRQPLTPTPYAIHAGTASNVVNGAVVKSLNNLKDNVTLAAGANVTLTPSGNTLTIAATGGAGGETNSLWSRNGADAYYNAGNIGIGTSTPASKLHVRSGASDLPARLESSGTSGFAAGMDFYLGAAGKGYVGVPDSSAEFAPGEMLVFGGAATKLSLWAGGARALTLEPDGNAYFGQRGRQMLNLFGVGYGIGIQTATLYSRSGGGFAWHVGGTHSDTTYDSGGGTTLMTLDNTRGLDFGSRLGQHLSLWGSDGPRRFGIGIQAQTLYSRTGGDAGDGFAWHKGGVHNDGVRNPGGGQTLMTLDGENGLAVSGNATQARDKGGFVKAMAKVNADGSIARQYSALGGAIIARTEVGPFGTSYLVVFPFQVNDRFLSVTPFSNGAVIAASVIPNSSTEIAVQMANVEDPGNRITDEFFIVVY